MTDDLIKQLKNQRVLVTGATGFMGQRLVDILLSAGAYVSALVLDIDFASRFYRETYMSCLANRIEKTITGDLRNYFDCERAVAESRPTIIFHLAAITQVCDASRMPLQAFDSNIMGTANLLEAARKIAPGEIAIVVASSDKAFGEPIDEMPFNENSVLNPIHPYDVSKASADLVARCYALHYGEKVAITRCGNVYGPGDINWQRLIPEAIRCGLTGKTLIIRSDGSLVREYNYVDDIIDAYIRIALSLMPWGGQPEPWALGTSWTVSDNRGRMSVLEIVDKISAVINQDIKIDILGKAQDETGELILESGLIRRKLDWRPKTELPEGLRKTTRWLVKHLRSRGEVVKTV